MINQVRKQLEPLGHNLGIHDRDAGQVAARPREAGDEAALDRIPAADEDDRNRRGRVLRRSCSRGCICCDYVDVAADEIGRKQRQLVISTLRREIAVTISSTTPSTKYSCSGSPLRLSNGRTAMDGRCSEAAGLDVPGSTALGGPPARQSRKGAGFLV